MYLRPNKHIAFEVEHETVCSLQMGAVGWQVLPVAALWRGAQGSEKKALKP